MHPEIKHCIVFWERLKAFKWFCAPTLQIGFVCVYVELCVCVRVCDNVCCFQLPKVPPALFLWGD